MTNYKENLFELIRKEEVIIFAGAGLSIYAGFPSGIKLKEIIYNELTKSEKKEISEYLNLTELTEQFSRIRNNNRNALTKILNETFLKPPSSKPTVHHKISSVPHINTLITTNYDKLLEESYGNKAQMIYSESQIPLIDKSKVQIFKIHGDLIDPTSIIISQSDYNNFFKQESEKNLFWSIIKERLATKSVLFLGYNLEDPNVAILFDKITEAFEANRREAFLIAPDLKKHKQTDLIRKGINYIDSTAEILIDELLQNIKENIATDLHESKVNPETFRKFLKNLELVSDLKGEPDGLKLKQIRSLNGQIDGKLSLTFKQNSKIAKKFLEFSEGKKFGEFELTEKELEDIRMGLGGIQMPEIKGAYKLKFIDRPRFDTKVDIRFEDGFEYEDFPVKVYGSPHKIEIRANISFVELKIEIDPKTFPNPFCNFTYQHGKTCSKTSKEIKFFEFLIRLTSGLKITIFKDSKKISEQNGISQNELMLDAKIYLSYFKNLKTIENFYNIKFENIDFEKIDDTIINDVEQIVSVLSNGYYFIDLDHDIVVEFKEVDDTTISQLSLIGKKDHKFEFGEKEAEIYNLYGQNLNLGIKTLEIVQPFVSNLKELKNNSVKFARIKSKKNKAKISYLKPNLTSP